MVYETLCKQENHTKLSKCLLMLSDQDLLVSNEGDLLSKIFQKIFF